MERVFNYKRLVDLRQEKGISQRAMARNTGIKQANISRWETGIVLPNILDLWVLADFFDVSVDYLIGRSEDY